MTTRFSNRSAQRIDLDLLDAFRADGEFEFSPQDPADLYWAYDRHFGQAYGVRPTAIRSSARRPVSRSYGIAIRPERWPLPSHPESPTACLEASSPARASSTSIASRISSRARSKISWSSR